MCGDVVHLLPLLVNSPDFKGHTWPPSGLTPTLCFCYESGVCEGGGGEGYQGRGEGKDTRGVGRGARGS